jgi:hypothetical protein
MVVQALRRAGAIAAVLLATAVHAGAGPTPARFPPDMSAGERRSLESLAQGADVSTRVDAQPFLIRHDVFEYLLDHPHFATNVARALKLAKYRIWQTPDGLALDDGYGTTGRFWVAHAGPGVRVMRARGAFKKGVLPTIQGDAATMIEYTRSPRPGGKSLIQSTVTGFVRLDSRLLAMGFRFAAAIAQRKADQEALNLMKLFAGVSRELDRNPAKVYERVRAQKDVPGRELEEFGRILGVR